MRDDEHIVWLSPLTYDYFADLGLLPQRTDRNAFTSVSRVDWEKIEAASFFHVDRPEGVKPLKGYKL